MAPKKNTGVNNKDQVLGSNDNQKTTQKKANNKSSRAGKQEPIVSNVSPHDIDGFFVVQGSIDTNVVTPTKSGDIKTTDKKETTADMIDSDFPADPKDESMEVDGKASATIETKEEPVDVDGDDDLFADLKISKKEIEESMAKKQKTGDENENSSGKPYLQVMKMKTPAGCGATKCGVMFRMMDKKDNQYWCYKANIVIETLQIMAESVKNHYTNYFAHLKSLAVRAVPHGPNEQLIVTAKSNDYQIPVYAVAVFLDKDPMDNTFETACDKFINYVSRAMKSKTFRSVFLTVSEKMMTEKFNKTLNQSNQLFFAHAKLATIKTLPEDSLDAMLLDQDIAGWMVTCFPTFNTNNAPRDIIEIGWRDGNIPEETITMLEMRHS